MPLFTANHDEAKNMFEPIAPGKYEAFISKAEATKSSKGNDMVKLELTIRTDVPQEYQKRKLFDNVVFTDTAMFKAQQLAKAVGIPNGAPVDTTAEFVKWVALKPVKIQVIHREEEYQGNKRTRENIAFYDASEKAMGGSMTADPFANTNAGGSIDISDDDLPF